MRNHKLKVLSMALLLLSGCSNTGNGGGDTGTVSTADEAVTLENPVRLDQLGVLPASNSSAASYLLQLTNYSKDKYTLDSVRVIDLDTAKDSELVSVASQACSTVSANGSCSIQLTPHTSQSADVKLEVNLKDKLGVNTKLVQLIRISGELNANNGGIVMLNDVDRIMTEDGNYSLSIPVVLGESYDDIKASNGSLICNTKGYQKGSSCTYQVRGKVLSGTKALSSSRAALSDTNEVIVVSTRLEGIKAGKIATVQEANTKVEVAKGAHLLLSHGTKINAPNTSAEITVFNNGNIAAKGIAASVEATSGLKIEANTCTDLEANNTCKVKVNLNSTTNGQGSVKVAYKDKDKDNTAQTNVRYTVVNASAGVKLTVKNSNLANAIIGGKTREALIEVTNNGNRRLEGVSYYLAPAGNSGLTVEKRAENGCDLTGGKLEVQQTCYLSVKYKPLTAFEGSKSINLVINSKYIDQNEQSHSLISAVGLDYSAIKVGSGNLVWSTNSGNGDLAIVNDGNATGSTIWELRNTLAKDENLSAKNVNVTLDPATIDGLSVAATDEKACPANATIAGGGACQYKVSYGPTSVVQKETVVDLNAAYNFYDGTPEASVATFKVVSSATLQPKIDVKIEVYPTDGTTLSGDGSSQLPWSFNAYHDKTISLQYTFTNSGTLDAEQFNLDTGNLPRGTALKDTTCPTGSEPKQLELGGSCIANVDIPDPELFTTVPNLTTNSLNSASLKLDLPYSYKYNNQVYHGQADTKHANFNRLWANVTHTVTKTDDSDNEYIFEVQSKLSGIDGVTAYPITITPTMANPIAGANFTACTIANADEDNCINTLSIPKNMLTAGNTLIVAFKTSADSMDDKNTIVSTMDTIGASIVPIRNQAELVGAFAGSTEGKLFVLENDIALTGNWTPVKELKNATFDGQGYKINDLVVVESSNAGMFSILSDRVVIKNLALKGSLLLSVRNSGLLAGFADDNISISNSHFNSKVGTPLAERVGGVIGETRETDKTRRMVKFESVTVISEVKGKNLVGGLVGVVNSGINFNNIRIKSIMTGENRVGGVTGSIYLKDHFAKNIIADTTIGLISGRGSQIGGLFAATVNMNMSNIDATINITGDNAGIVGGIVGNLSWSSERDFNDSISNAIVRGVITASANPTVKANRISGIGSATTNSEVNRAIDMTTIAYTNGTTTTNYVSPLTALDLSKYVNSGNVFYFLPAGATYIEAANPEWVSPLEGTTAETQKIFLTSKGFDFNNTWTIKKDSANNDIIGIKEDSIPQFPKW